MNLPLHQAHAEVGSYEDLEVHTEEGANIGVMVFGFCGAARG